MARHNRGYDGERFTVKRTLQLMPSQAAELDAAAARAGATWSDFVRELLCRRMGTPATVAGARRDPQTIAIIRALDRAAFETSAVGNNTNQIARIGNTNGEFGPELVRHIKDLIALQRKAADLHIAALDVVLERHARGRAGEAA
jgi:phage FluMu protein gp41